MKANSIEEFLGTLQQSVVESWKSHLKTDKYSAHMALDEFYKEMPELVDTLIENYMGEFGKVDDYKNLFKEDEIGAIKYLEELKEMVRDGREKFLEGKSELESDCDAILSQIDSTLYKLKELKESSTRTLVDFLKESLK